MALKCEECAGLNAAEKPQMIRIEALWDRDEARYFKERLYAHRPKDCCGSKNEPIALAATSLSTSRGFFPWRLSDAGPGAPGSRRHGPVDAPRRSHDVA
jgi:hypothetical protein